MTNNSKGSKINDVSSKYKNVTNSKILKLIIKTN